MYQTVGQDAIHLVAEALDVPLYRRIITGSAVQQTTEYGSRSANHSKGVNGDETEDLYELLLQVKVRIDLFHSSNLSNPRTALDISPRYSRGFCWCYLVKLSTTQSRARVNARSADNNVMMLICPSARCERLGLTSLCYLWQRDQRELLDEMIQASLIAVIIKVAGIGLTVQHLGKTLGDMRPTLHKLV